MRRIFFITPTLRPVGGVVKIFDYLQHASGAGYECTVVCEENVSSFEELNLFRIPNFVELKNTLRIQKPINTFLTREDFIFFSLPSDLELATYIAPYHLAQRNIIHIIQNTRHANPAFQNGLALRMLSYRFSRISISKQVFDVIQPFVPANGCLHKLIIEGHNTAYFFKKRNGFDNPKELRVGYTTWKSEIGLEIESVLNGMVIGDRKIVFKSIRTEAAWSDTKELYHWCDVFLACPLAQEGFYLPGLEALAAGCLLVIPNVEGNMAYCEFNKNCLPVRLNDVMDYCEVIMSCAKLSDSEVRNLQHEGYETIKHHTLEHERREFLSVLKEIQA